MNQLSLNRFLFAIGAIILGAFLAGQFLFSFERAAVMATTMLIALVVMMWGSQPETQRNREIEDRLLQDELFRARKQAYQDIIDPIVDPVLLIRTAKVAFANKAARNLLGDHIMGEDVRMAIRHPASADRLANPNIEHVGDPILLVGIGRSDQRWEMRISALPGDLKLVLLSDQSNKHAAEKMRTDFVANASHELRTPLASIKGFLETLENPEAGGNPETRARFLKIMFSEAENMQNLIDDLMSLSRIEAEKFQIPEEEIDVSALIREVAAVFEQRQGKNGSPIVLDLDQPALLVHGDKAQLSQLLHNLISNALKYGEKGAPIAIKMVCKSDMSILRLTISDQGDGIAAEHIPRLTERFYRIDKGRTRSVGGTGLGLSIVKHIAVRHGGRLDITSKVGEGTHVTVTLPIPS